ncbi:MAG: formylglycine-generating enzyme family protein [Thermodesulfovibrionales bacterium]
MKQIVFIVITGLFSALLFSCAAGGNIHQAPDSDASMVVIPKGWFTMGSDSGELNERPEHEVLLDTFRIDLFEVSAVEFAEFLNAASNPDNKYFTHNGNATVMGVTYSEGKETETLINPTKYIPRQGFEKYPANNVSWFGAAAYCRWKGKRLPTEAEWEKAGKGTDLRTYPWGNSLPDPLKARYKQKLEESGLQVLVPVDSLPSGRSPYGVFNMAGNVWEWVADWYRMNYCDFCDPGGSEYNSSAAELLEMDKPVPGNDAVVNTPPNYNSQGPRIGSFKVLRGGAWSDGSEPLLRNSLRYWLDPLERYIDTGFRCAE